MRPLDMENDNNVIKQDQEKMIKEDQQFSGSVAYSQLEMEQNQQFDS